MALSDYANITFDSNANIVEDGFKIRGLEIGPYKTRLYIRSKELWNENTGFVEPTIGRFNSGNLTIHGVDFAGETPDLKTKEGVNYNHILLWSVAPSIYREDRDNNFYCGICAYAYTQNEEALIKRLGYKHAVGLCSCSENGREHLEFYDYPEEDFDNFDWNDKEKIKELHATRRQIDTTPYKDILGLNAYCGITQDMIDALVAFLNRNYRQDLAAKIAAKKDITYVNQGNAYFAKMLGGNAAQNIGEKDVLMHKILAPEVNRA